MLKVFIKDLTVLMTSDMWLCFEKSKEEKRRLSVDYIFITFAICFVGNDDNEDEDYDCKWILRRVFLLLSL